MLEAILLALLVLRVLAAPVLIGAVLVVGWLLVGPLLTIPRFSTATGPVVRNGVAAIVACGKKQGMAGIDEALRGRAEDGDLGPRAEGRVHGLVSPPAGLGTASCAPRACAGLAQGAD